MTRLSRDRTLERNKITYYKGLIEEYELVKAKGHPRYKFVTDFYHAKGLKRQNFIKYYHRYRENRDDDALLPGKRGPKIGSNVLYQHYEDEIIEYRRRGLSRYEIYAVLRSQYAGRVPSPTTIYTLCRNHGLGKRTPRMAEEKRRIIKDYAGEMAHVDCKYLPQGLIVGDDARYYLVACMDDASRLCWATVSPSLTALRVMFASLKNINILKALYDIQFDELLSDNGSEFGAGKNSNNKEEHPFEVMLQDLGIKHRYTKPYRPQTNGKIERFWRTIMTDLFEETVFDSMDNMLEELDKYMFYYNNYRPHQALGGKTPLQTRQTLPPKPKQTNTTTT